MIVRLPLLVGMVILGMAMVAAGGDNAKNIVGVWQRSNPTPGEPPIKLEFSKDGKMKVMAMIGDVVDVQEGT